MSSIPLRSRLARTGALTLVLALAGCGDDAPPPVAGAAGYVLASVVITPEGRTTYVQALPELPTGHVTNTSAIELPGNGTMLAHGRDVFIGLAEEPTWVRYSVGDDGRLAETGRMSLANLGLSAIDYGNTIVDDTTAVSVSSEQYLAVVWNPADMTITGTIDLAHLKVPGYTAEVWTTLTHDGKVYVPGRWSNWDDGLILPRVMMTILDPVARTVVAVAEDDRCASGGRAVFGADGYAYVMGDGRNYAIQMYAHARAETPPANCLLRIAPGATDFDPAFHVEIPALTGGFESVTELETAVQGSGIGFTKVFYPAQLPPGVEPKTFDFWSYPAFKTWRLELGDTPTAVEVQGVPYSTLGFEGASVGGKLYSGESPDYTTSTIYEIDPVASTAVQKFTMDGLFYGLRELR